MNIGFDARLYGIHHRGIGKYTELLLSELYKKLPAHTLIIFGDAKLKKQFPLSQVVEVNFRAYSFKEQLLFSNILTQANCDLYHFPHFNVPWSFSRPYIVTIHDLIIHEFPNERATTLPRLLYKLKLFFYYYLFKHNINKASQIICVSNTTKKILLKFYPTMANKIQVVYEAPTLSTGIPDKLVLSGQYFLYVGAAYPHKNLEFLIRSFKKAVKDWPEVKLILVGRPDFFYKRLKRESGDDSRIVFWGEANTETLANLYRHCLAYISPGLQEGFNLSALDSVVFGKNLLLSDIEINREVFKNYGHYFDPTNENSLIKVLQDVLSGVYPPVNALLIKATLVHLNWAKAANEIQDLYHQVLKRG